MLTTAPTVPSFPEQYFKDSQWIDGLRYWSGFPQELSRRGMEGAKEAEQEVENEELSFRKKALIKNSTKEEAMLFSSNDAQGNFEGHNCSPFTLVALLKACAQQKDLETGSRVHADVVRKGLLETNVVIGNSIVSMYAKCGSLKKAQELCDNFPLQNVVSWNVLIAGYAQHGQGEQALDCFKRMQSEGFSPDAVTIVCILKACGSMEALGKGEFIHAKIIREGLLEKDIVVGNALVDMYAKCGSFAKALGVCEKLPARNVVSWNALIAGYTTHGHNEDALSCFHQMQAEGLSPDAVSFVCILKSCASIGAADIGQELHAEIAAEGLLGRDVFVGTALIDMYAKCGLLAKAQEVFDGLPVRNVVSWSALIAGYAHDGNGEEALHCFERMQLEGVSSNAVTFVCALNACGITGAADKGQEIHSEIVNKGFEKHIDVGIALVDMYIKCGLLVKAQEVFNNLPLHDIVLWNVLIEGYTLHGVGEEALNCFERLQSECVCPNAVTFVCILKACGSIGAVDKGQAIHNQIVRGGLLDKDVVGTALVDMYAKCGMLAKAQEVFDMLSVWDLVLWNALITGYAQHGYGEQAWKCYEQMQVKGHSPNIVTFVCMLKACGSIGAADKGHCLHTEIVREGLLEKHNVIGNSLVDMYAKCGWIFKAQEVFDYLPVHNAVSWNALITGYALLGKVENVFHSFGKMIGEGIKPDLVTYTIVLNACSHTGLLDKGQWYFDTMFTGNSIIPTLEHYTCMVDLFGRAGHLDKAVAMLKEMPFFANLVGWHTMLGACQKWGNVKLGRLAFEHAVHLDEKNAAAYICMRNIYTDAEKGRQAMRAMPASKNPEQLWADVNGQL